MIELDEGEKGELPSQVREENGQATRARLKYLEEENFRLCVECDDIKRKLNACEALVRLLAKQLTEK